MIALPESEQLPSSFIGMQRVVKNSLEVEDELQVGEGLERVHIWHVTTSG